MAADSNSLRCFEIVKECFCGTVTDAASQLQRAIGRPETFDEHWPSRQ